MIRSTLLLRTTTRQLSHSYRQTISLSGSVSSVRFFARKSLEEQELIAEEKIKDEEMKKLLKVNTDKKLTMKQKEYTPDEMELMNSSAFATDEPDDNEDDEDDDDENDDNNKSSTSYNTVAAVKSKQKFANMKGRMWHDPYIITDEMYTRKIGLDDLPDWTPAMASRISQERIKMYEGIPTLEQLANIPLPPPAPPCPGLGRTRVGRTGTVEYGKWRAIQLENYISKRVQEVAQPEVKRILALSNWDDKQDAVDILFETVEASVGEEETVLSLHPRFGEWVEKSLQNYLETVAKQGDSATPSPTKTLVKDSTDSSDSSDSDTDSESNKQSVLQTITDEDDAAAVPIFVDLYDPNDVFEEPTEEPEEYASRICNIPKILHPLKVSHTEKRGRVVEEWELSAHDTARHIMLRQCTREAARMMAQQKSSRIYIHGREGTGKTAVLATLVAAARKSGHIVLFMPDGDRLRRDGYYIEPSTIHKGLYDLPNLSQEVCTEFLECHEKDLEGFTITEELRDKHFSKALKQLLPEESKEELTVVGLLKIGKEHVPLAPMCYSAVMEFLMEQEEKPFVIAMDEFNCYHDYSPSYDHYFHMTYDVNVVNAIPYALINLFRPALEAMGIFHDHDAEAPPKVPKPMKRGAVIVATTESRAIARKFTDGLTASAHHAFKYRYRDAPIKVIEVPRYSILEVEHIISHFEVIGVGFLRFDHGETVMDENEMAYLRMVSGSVGQKLIDACVLK